MMWARLTWRALLVVSLFTGGLVAMFCGFLWLVLLIHAKLMAFLLWGTLNPNSRLFGPIMTHTCEGVWLTIDDGPDPRDTPQLLDLLDRHGAKATFFLIGEKARLYPDLVREIVNRGHEVGNHTYQHPQAAFWSYGPYRTWREIVRCQRVLTEITGQSPRWFRAPVGHSNVFVHPVLDAMGLRLVGWSSRGFDGVSASLADVKRRIRSTARDGAIILAHESTPIAPQVVGDILSCGDENGWRFVIPDDEPRSGSC